MRIKLYGLVVWAAMLAAGVVSCQQHDDIPQGVKYPILFDSPDTRATATIADLKTNGFMVYAFVDGNAGSTSFAKKVTHSVVGDRDIWAFESPEYWIPNTDYYFKAFYPSVPSAGTLTVANTDENQDFSITGFDITQQEDIMVASATASVDAGASAPTNGSVVPLKFEHLLANVIVKIKSEIPNVTVSNVSFEGVAQSSKYEKNKWTAGQTVSFGKQYTGDPLVKDAENYVDVTSGGILVIPEKINGSQKMYITTSHNVYDFILQPITWESGMLYTYTLTIKQEYIIFNEPTVEIWDEENATGSVIIK